MDAVPALLIQELRPRILERRERLEAAAGAMPVDYVNDLLAEIDLALRKIEDGSYGLCETCHDAIEADRLENNPLARFCLDHLTAREMRAHEEDLKLATQIQVNLLPPKQMRAGEGETQFRYVPAGVVGGDYCEIVGSGDGGSLFFAVGDVTGKGVAASLLMTHLSAIFRSLLSLELPLPEVMARANRLFCESTPATHYATLVAGRAGADGLEICNAGHCRPLLVRRGGTDRIDSTGMPLGLFCEARYGIREIGAEPGDSLVLYSDGITEAQNREGEAYEEEGLIGSLDSHTGREAEAVADGVMRDVIRFRGAGAQQDDMTLLILRRR